MLRITGNIDGTPADGAYQIPDAEAVLVLFDLLQREGLCLGGSSGINFAAVTRLARDLGPGHRVVTVLCDSGTRVLQSGVSAGRVSRFQGGSLRRRKTPNPLEE